MQPPAFRSVSVACGGHYGHEVIVALAFDDTVWQLKDGKWMKLDKAWEPME